MKLLINKTLRTFMLLFFAIFLIEMIFKGVMELPFDWSVLRIALGITVFSSLLAIIFSFFNKFWRNFCIILILLVATIYAIAQAGFNDYFTNYMSLATSTQAEAITGFIGDFIKSIKPHYYLLLIPFVLFVIYLIFFEKKINTYESNLEVSFIDKIRGKKKKEAARLEQQKKLKKKNLVTRLSFLLAIVVFSIFYYLSLGADFMQNKTQSVTALQSFKNPSMTRVAVSQFGIEGFAFVDIKALIFQTDEEVEVGLAEKRDIFNNVKDDLKREIDDSEWIKLNDEETVPDFKKLNEYFMSKEITPKNEYTGMFKGKNLLVIMIESGSNVLINYPEYFPNFAKIYNGGWSWENAFSPRNACSTGNNEMSGITSLYTINRNCTANVYKGNTYYESLFNLFNEQGYNTSSYHDFDDHFYYRHDYHPNMGSRKFYGVYDLGMRLGSEYQPWPCDDDFAKKALPKFINNDKFMAWMTTVSSHMKYSYSSVTGDKYLNLFKKEKWSLENKRYMSKLKIVDDMFGVLLDELEKSGKLNDTVLMIYADHEPYGLDESTFKQITKYDISSNGDVDRTPFIIYNPKLESKKYYEYTSFMNITPTIANLFDLDYDPRLYGGYDLLSDAYPNYVAFADGSWRSDKAYFDAAKGKIKYLGEETYTDEELSYINNSIKNEMAMNNLAIKRDYFTYLNKKLNKGFKPGEGLDKNKNYVKKEKNEKGE